MEFVPELSYGEASENILIHGDNLEALLSLLPSHAGKVKCIFIDPPYNTKSAFEHYDDNLQHAEWLAMMHPRLRLLRDLLSDDGIMFAIIDDRECHYLKVMMDEIFGRRNFCGSLIWEKKKKPSFLHSKMGNVTESILAYAKNIDLAPAFEYGATTANKKWPLNNAGNPLKTLTFPAGSVHFGCRDQVFDPQNMSEGNIITELLDRVEISGGVNKAPFRLRGEWRYTQAKLDEVLASGGLIRISKSPFRPNHIKPGGEPKKLKNLLSAAHYGMATYEDAAIESTQLFGPDAFDYPKPEKLLMTVLGAVTHEDDLVLDSFLGSGTTAAVAMKMRRRFIGIEMGEHAMTHCAPRLHKVIDGEQGGVSKDAEWTGGSGFRFYRLGDALAQPNGQPVTAPEGVVVL
jgi:adenine-specific DNA-methyltransferase